MEPRQKKVASISCEFSFTVVLCLCVGDGEIEQLLILYWYPLLTVLGVLLMFLRTLTLPGLRGAGFIKDSLRLKWLVWD